MERVHRKILRTIQGLPTRCSSASLTTLLGSRSVHDLINLLSFIVSTANLPAEALPRRILEARANSTKGVVSQYQEVLAEMSLSDLSQLLENTPREPTWKSFTGKQLAIRAHMPFLESCEDYHISSCDIKMLRPLPHWSSTVGEPKLTRMNNFRIRLLVGCDGLEQDASCFRTRNNGATPKDPTCKLCKLAVEDADHFVAR